MDHPSRQMLGVCMDATAKKNKYNNSDRPTLQLVHRIRLAQQHQIRLGATVQSRILPLLSIQRHKAQAFLTLQARVKRAGRSYSENHQDTHHPLQQARRESTTSNRSLEDIAHSDGVSPSQLFFGRRQQQQLSLTAEQTQAQESSTAGRDTTAGKSKRYRNKHTSEFTDPHCNQQVWMQHHITGKWDT